ncbi:DUF4224 domain-containing protein [Xylella fastidiosa subsp. sandyi]|uniref:DUF4224 domain-containing protein n=1 Tax=Xylella fastidiosa TaxID=2371 RepID=UPI0008FFFD3C|nr:DUF4224 domain-containing protein [Xylella fastidiosa]MDD0930255.1 DUF4224 domain-containing protein [Xylella fastidiosa subsp. multiplex]QTX28729.1 DUF4224 domain-containing protein [Xylella fastidiosa subsp. multiplex]RWA44043.1 DUF4224 domain-containing protein [Xylella fastidiosa subsp. sandyi]TNV88320.1 DUF4224 domain-containing protein [Xylella fastidiosa]TNV99430.1 DUF4224 domain-containing protein [Xylella fastidiosa]
MNKRPISYDALVDNVPLRETALGDSEFLTPEEMHTLTGYQFKSCQCRWLTNNGWRFTISRNGFPIISRKYLHMRLIGESAHAADTSTYYRTYPNLDAIRKR